MVVQALVLANCSPRLGSIEIRLDYDKRLREFLRQSIKISRNVPSSRTHSSLRESSGKRNATSCRLILGSPLLLGTTGYYRVLPDTTG
eukprot:665922-Amorphochlora_amoeboformis.AAC.1